MRANLAVFLVLAAGVAGCARPAPPPPPMVAVEPAPMPAPAPVATGPIDGVYKGAVMANEDSPRRCRKVTTATTRVRNNAFQLAGMRGRVGPDGAVTGAGPRGATMTGSLNNGTLDVTTMAGGCGYHYTLSHS